MGDAPVRISALGPLEVRVGAESVELGPAKQRSVLAVLLELSPDPVPVERIIDEVWAAGGPRDPGRSIQVYVSALRKAFGPEGSRLSTVGRAYRLDLPEGASDVDRFVTAAKESAELHRAGDHDGAVATAERALALWRGEAWQDVREVPCIAAAVVRLDELRLEVRATRGAALLALGRHRDLVGELEQLVARHPLREDLRGQLMVALHRSGRQAEALDVYARGRRHLVEETGLEPGSELRSLHEAVLADAPSLRVDDADLRSRRHLPAPATELIGREHDTAEILGQLGAGTRLVTLTGPGGVGKTRLALQVAHRAAAEFPGGVWFVDLAELTGAGQVPQSVAEALDVEPAGDDFVGPVLAFVADRRLLLVLDNFEQVADAAPLVAQLLEAGEGVHVLVTSRVPLRVYGERVRKLDPLASEDAVALFTARAVAADHRFDVTDVDLVRRICSALDRLPLAIELVAARAADFRLDELVTGLGDRLALAVDGPPERSIRQRSLRAAIEWSTALLTEEDAIAFARLGVFHAGWLPEAAAEVASVSRDQLTRLARASLVVAAGDRFRMLETIREYAVHVLGASGEQPSLHARYADHYLRLAEQARPGMKGTESAALIRRLRAERANLRAALEHLHAAGEYDDLLRMATALTVFWYRTAPASEDVDWVERALELAPDADARLRARGLYGLAICRGEQGRSDDALAMSRECYRLFKSIDDETWTARALNTLAGLTRDRGDAEEAVRLQDEAVALRRRLQDPDLPLGVALANRAILGLDQGDWASARTFLDEARELAGEDPLEQAMVDSLLADLAVGQGDTDEVRRRLSSAIPVLREHELEYRLVECLDTFAALAVRLSRPQDAALLVAAADRALADSGSSQVPADCAFREARVGPALAGLDPGERAAACAAGARLELDEALDLATERFLR